MRRNPPHPLSYAVRPRVVFKYLGQLLLMLSLLSCAPLLVSLLAEEYRFSGRYIAVIALLAVSGKLMARLRVPPRMRMNEGLVVAGSVFTLSSLALTYPLMAADLGFADAFFESVSAVTTTGLTTVTGIDRMPATFQFARAWMQWYGGLGILVLSAALILRPGIVARQLGVGREAGDDLAESTRAHARKVLLAYGVLSGAAVLLLLLTGLGWWPSLLHAMTAVSTAGFSTRDGSLAELAGWPGQAVIMIVCVAGAVPLILYHRAARRGWRSLAGDFQLRGLLGLALLGAFATTLALRHLEGLRWLDALHHGPLLALSAQTTTGFSTLPVGGLGSAALLLLIAAMFIGGGAGSTAGGIKIVRLLVALRCVLSALRRTTLPRDAVTDLRLGSRRLEEADVRQTLMVMLIFAGVIAASWLPFLMHEHDPLDSLFEVVSATGTVGLSAGLVGPGLEPSLKGILCLDMLLGRVEVLALLVLFYPPTWFGRRVAAP